MRFARTLVSMDGVFGQIGGALLVLCVVGLWLAVLVPGWVERRNMRTTARNAARVQRAVNVIARNQELPEEYEQEVDARRAMIVEREARRLERQRVHNERQAARRAVPEYVRQARRGIAVGSGVALVSIMGLLIGVTQIQTGLFGILLITAGLVFGALGLLMRSTALRNLRGHHQSAQPAAAPADVPVFDQAGFADAQAEDERDEASAEHRQWTPTPIPEPLGVTREAVIAAALAEAARTGESVDAPGLRPGVPTGPDAEVHRLHPEVSGHNAEVDEVVAALENEEVEPGYAWMDQRAGVDASFDSERLDDILDRRRDVG